MRVIHTADRHIGQTLSGCSRDYEHQVFCDCYRGRRLLPPRRPTQRPGDPIGARTARIPDNMAKRPSPHIIDLCKTPLFAP